MKRTLAITTAVTLLAIPLTACGAEGRMPDSSEIAGGTTATDTMRTDRMPGTGTAGGATANTRTGTADGSVANPDGLTDGTGLSAPRGTLSGDPAMTPPAGDTAESAENGSRDGAARSGAANPDGTASGLGTVAGAARYGLTGRDGSVYGVGGPNSSVYTATNNGGLTGERRDSGVSEYRDYAETAVAAAEGDRYARMLVNARVHDHDGFLFDGENTSYDTF